MKKVLGIYGNNKQHWVGDGFPVRSLFSYNTLGSHASPFLLLDHAGPTVFPADSTHQRGVGEHPHRGFETVTVVYQGEVEHRDSTGAGGRIGPGDVQWMTAGSGILHEEFHSRDFARQGGTLEMVQLWVNLPAKDKMTAPRYQTLTSQQIPVVPVRDAAGQEAGSLRVIAGDYLGHLGPAQTFTPIDMWDLRLDAGKAIELELPEGRNVALVVLRGTVMVNDQHLAREASMALLDRGGQRLQLEANNSATVLLLSGAPIDEPIVGHGPFVMNSAEQIEQAIDDFRSGRFGRIPPQELAQPAETPTP
ncbi:redox-sensitive bicupin YhaK (pirin superfamily) [Paucibacter oligotrophus]|uniref:Redox-sensitive bicupin YhaK (Pirin superfamily) n=1 Tax=Roseateles oligotrophus TaxID=1769250 RepID=A0A840LBV3_9BURK|nr:pirin family protein [Roseateles oligotrophus]MBB4845636.1 redox-sensitive bicupin YhaK (pirin superfamily) [Roseateles oligotrophus]